MDLTTGVRKRLDDASEYVYAALIIILSIIAMTIFLWLMYDNRGLATTAEQMALMNALFISDTLSLVVASAAVALCLCLSSLHFGDLRGQLRLETFAVFFMIMIAPVVFIGADILLQPKPLEDLGVNIALGLSVISIVSGVLLIALSVMRIRPGERIEALIDRIREDYHSAGTDASADSITVMPQMAGTSLSLMVFLKKLSAAGDPGPARLSIDRLSQAALAEAGIAQDVKSLAAASGLIAHIVEVGAIGAETGNLAIVCRAVERLKDIATTADIEAVSSAAFRGIGCRQRVHETGRPLPHRHVRPVAGRRLRLDTRRYRQA